jgi:hypothetical protein
MAKKVYIDFELRYKEAVANLDEMQKEYTKLEKKVNKYEQAVEKSNDSVDKNDKKTKKATGSTVAFTGALASLTGGATAAFVALKAGIVSAVAGFATLKVAVMSSGIGLIAVAIISVIQAFKRSEKGQNKFTKLMAMIGAVTNEVLDVLANFGMKIVEFFEAPGKALEPLLNILSNVKDSIVDVFTNPIESLKNFGKMLVGNIIMRFKAFMDTLGFAGRAIKKLFEGEFDEAWQLSKKSVSSLSDAITGVEDSVDKATKAVGKLKTQWEGFNQSFDDYLKKVDEEIRITGEIEDKRAEAVKRERALQVERAEADRKIAELREQAADKENIAVEDRIAALKEAGRIEAEITNKEIAAAKLRFDAKVAENELGHSTTEDLNEEAKLKAELINLETGRLKLQKALTAEITTAIREAETLRKQEAAELEANYIFLPGVGFVSKEAYEAAKANGDAIEKIQADFRKKKEDEAAETEIQKIELEKSRKLKELEDLNATQAQKAEIIQYYNDRIQKAQEKSDAVDLKNQEAVNKAKVNMAKATLSNIATALGENSKAGKAAAAAASLINTYQGITAELATKTVTPFEFAIKLANIATTAAIGFKSVKDILATEPTTTSVPSKSVAAGGGGGSQAPAFNIVGAGVTSQLADVIAGQSQQPTRAYVVSNDVSTAQEMDRNIIEGASIG